MTEAPTFDGGGVSLPTGELAKALAEFQKTHYAAGKTGKAQGRDFSTLKDICNAIRPAAELGLSHTETWHPIGTEHALVRVTLRHTSGQTVTSELPVDVTQKNRSGSREQAQGSAMTYARRYLLLGIYGLANDDEDDDGDSTRTAAPEPAAKPVAKLITPTQTVAKPAESAPAAPKTAGVVFMTDSEKAQCIASLKGLSVEKREKLKADFKAEFKISAVKISPEHFQLPKHGDWVKANLASYQ
tara:strand:- start:4338 stop:5066 length:729 start_codon:yes stop_codon:yes gene_type:complete